VTHKRRADTLPLVFVDDGESHLRLSRLHDDVAGAAHDHRAGAFLHHRDQGDMVDEVDVQEERDFLLAEVALYLEETAVKRLLTGAADGCREVCPVVMSKVAASDMTARAFRR
jgi:hypothetical protein